MHHQFVVNTHALRAAAVRYLLSSVDHCKSQYNISVHKFFDVIIDRPLVISLIDLMYMYIH